jgi:hypothetical protein
MNIPAQNHLRNGKEIRFRLPVDVFSNTLLISFIHFQRSKLNEFVNFESCKDMKSRKKNENATILLISCFHSTTIIEQKSTTNKFFDKIPSFFSEPKFDANKFSSSKN